MLSWVYGQRDGFAYDEATAIFARLFAWLGHARRAASLGERVEALVQEQGALGREGVCYAFDTALALPSLARPDAAARRVAALMTSGVACEPITRPGWWSQSYGPHLLKALVPLAATGRRALVDELAADLVARTFDGARFRIHAESPWCYLHSHCYAVEGLLGLGRSLEVVAASVDWLARQQRDDGSFPAWEGRPGAPRVSPMDVTAQAVRLFAAVAPDRHAEARHRALERLAQAQDPRTGGIRYDDTIPDQATWVAAFALQAVRWSASPPSQGELAWLL